MRAIYFDTETTGTRAGVDRIVEIAAFDPENMRSFVRLVNPGISIPQDAVNVHQISDAMVKDAPSFKEIAAEFLEFCDGQIALVAHNLINFDLPFLKAEFKRSGTTLPQNWVYVDSLIWARRYRKDLPRHSLQFLRKVYGVTSNQAHRALNDVMTLYEVFKTMTDDLTIQQIAALLGELTPTEPIKQPEVALSLF